MPRYLIPPTPSEDLPPPPPTARDFNIPDEAYGARTLFGSLAPGEKLPPEYWDEVRRANSTRAAELQNQFLDRQREILHTGADAYLTKTGRDAVLAAPDVLAKLEAARQDTIGQAANESQRRLLRTALGEHALLEHARVGTHAGEQSLEWQKQTATERLNQLRQQATIDYADPSSIASYDRASESAARERARTLKLGPDSAEAFKEVQNARSSIWRHAIEAALGKRDTKSAIILNNHAVDRMTPADSDVISPQIDAAKEHRAGQDYLAKLSIPDTRDIGELDAAHQAATEQNGKDWPDNDSQRATNQHFIDVAFGQKKRDADLARTDLLHQVSDWLGQPGQAQRPPLRLWTRLGPSDRQAVDNHLLQTNFHPTSPNGDEEETPPLDPQESPDATPHPIELPPEASPPIATNAPEPASIAVPAAWGEALPELLPELLTQAAKEIASWAVRMGPYVRSAASGVGAALPVLFEPGNTQATEIDLGDGLRALKAPGDLTVNIERKIDDGLLGTDVGTKWQRLNIAASYGHDSSGGLGFSVDARQLEEALGEAGAAQVLPRFVLPNDRRKFPPIVEIRMAETGAGEKVVIREVPHEEVEEVCSNYPRYTAIGMEAALAKKAAGLPNGMRYGQEVHLAVKRELEKEFIQNRLDQMGIVELSPELAILNGVRRSYSKGSSRIDIVEVYQNRMVVCAYDLKTGKAKLKDNKMIAYAEELKKQPFLVALKQGYRIFVMPIPLP